MSGAAPDVAPPPPIWPMYRAMVGIGLLCGVLIVGVFVTTRPTIERNRAEALERAILQVLPAARSSRSFMLDVDAGRFVPTSGEGGRGSVVHAGYDESGALIGLAIEARGMGYQDVIHVLYGYDFTQQAVIGLRVLASRETPGLGDKIEKDPDFQANFDRLDVTVGAGGALVHPIEPVEPGAKQHPWQVDGISGATISARAIARILGESTERWVPLVRARLDDFGSGA